MARRNVRNRKSPARKKREWKLPEVDWNRIMSVVVAVITLAISYEGTLWFLDRPITEVAVSGPFERVSEVEIEAAMAPWLQEGFLTADLDGMRQQLEAIPWVANASIRRSWPARLRIRVAEQEAVACWGGDGLMNRSGVVFVSGLEHVPMELPRLDGPAGSQAAVAGRFLELNGQLYQRGLSVRELRLDQRGALHLELSNGVRVRFGARSIDERIQRFFAALDSVIGPLGERVRYVDMRYPNGFAVGRQESGMNASGDQEPRPNA